MAEEKKYEKQIGVAVKKARGLCLKLLPFLVKGLPDRLVLLPGARIAFVEVKSNTKEPEKMQSYIHKKLRALGFAVWVVDSQSATDDFLKFYQLC